jgi:hypothetical protein
MEIAMMKHRSSDPSRIPLGAAPLVLLGAITFFIAVSAETSDAPVSLSSAVAATDGTNVHPASVEPPAAPRMDAAPISDYIDYTFVFPIE